MWRPLEIGPQIFCGGAWWDSAIRSWVGVHHMGRAWIGVCRGGGRTATIDFATSDRREYAQMWALWTQQEPALGLSQALVCWSLSSLLLQQPVLTQFLTVLSRRHAPPPGPVQVHFTGARRSHPCSLAAPGLPFLACKYNRLLFDEEQGKDEAKTKIEWLQVWPAHLSVAMPRWWGVDG